MEENPFIGSNDDLFIFGDSKVNIAGFSPHPIADMFGPRIQHKYGNEAMHDVVLEVGHADFHVNKSALAVQSDFFYALFYSDFKEKNQDRVKIEADEAAFKCLMDLVFKLRFKTSVVCPPLEFDPYHPIFAMHRDPLDGFKEGKNGIWAKALWNNTMGTLELAERFQMDNVRDVIADKLKERKCGNEDCVNCALKIFIRCVCKMIDPHEYPKISQYAFTKLFNWYSHVIGVFTMNGQEMDQFVKMICFAAP